MNIYTIMMKGESVNIVELVFVLISQIDKITIDFSLFAGSADVIGETKESNNMDQMQRMKRKNIEKSHYA